MKRLVKLMIACSVLIPSSLVWAESSKWSLLEFQANWIGVFQSGGATSMSGEVAWAPRIPIVGFIGLRPLAGVSLYKGTSSNFVVLEGMGFASFRLGCFDIEGGGGYQTWLSQNVNTPLAGGNIFWNFNSKLFGIADSVFGGYAKALSDSANSNEFKAGVLIRL